MNFFGQTRSLLVKRAFFCLSVLAFQGLVTFSDFGNLSSLAVQPAFAADASLAVDDFSSQYTALTKRILLAGVDLERFSLNYRLETSKRPKFRQLRYFATQEAGAGCGLGFEIASIKEFGIGRKHPLQIDTRVLKGGLITAMTGSIIAGSGSGLELSSNVYSGIKRRQHGYDARSATKTVSAKLKEIDRLLAEREALVAAHKDSPAYERAMVEGQILKEMRIAFVDEYSHFNIDSRKFFATQNMFFLLNAAYNSLGAAAAYVGDKSLHNPTLNGASNIMFIVSGAMAAVSPALSVMSGNLMARHARRVLDRELGPAVAFKDEEFSAKRKLLEELLPGAQGSLIPSLPATQRLAMYTESNKLFVKQLDNETHTIRRLQEVALQTNLLAPPIGGTLMTQGILGTVGYYSYRTRPRKQLNCGYAGAIVGCVGLSANLVGTAAWLLSSMAYEHKLKAKQQMPAQLIKARLQHLDDLQKLLEGI